MVLSLPLSAGNLVSNVDGKIRVIILHYGSDECLGFRYDQTVLYRELLTKMDKDVAFIILLGKDAHARKARESLKPPAEERLPDGTNRIKFLEVDVKTSEFYPTADKRPDPGRRQRRLGLPDFGNPNSRALDSREEKIRQQQTYRVF